jgi:catechol 2,3-dioxygenase-like lactoylglutathione lyase family enzyme
MFKRIDHVEIVTDQLDRTVQFYTEMLGFTVKARNRIERSGEFVWRGLFPGLGLRV